MNTLQERIDAGRELAVQRTQETEPVLSWFLAAICFTYNPATGEPIMIHIQAHFHSWLRYLDAGMFAEASPGEIADRFISWTRNALEIGFLTADDPPMAKGIDWNTPLVDLVKARLAELRGTIGPPPAW